MLGKTSLSLTRGVNVFSEEPFRFFLFYNRTMDFFFSISVTYVTRVLQMLEASSRNASRFEVNNISHCHVLQ